MLGIIWDFIKAIGLLGILSGIGVIIADKLKGVGKGFLLLWGHAWGSLTSMVRGFGVPAPQVQP